jgi:hypothetical protein
MMREFGNPNAPANINQPQPEEIMRSDKNAPTEGLRPFHVEMDNQEGYNNAKIIGGVVVVGLLIIGGGIYAYESMHAPAPQQVALKTPAVNHPALDQTAAAPPPPATALEATTPGNNAAPQPALAPKASRAAKAANNPDDNSMASAATAPAADPAINAPMTLAPETASAPEQSAPTGQTAMQQPVTAPDVSSPATQPTPEIANNNAALPAPVVAPQLPAPQLPAAQPEQPQPVPAQ